MNNGLWALGWGEGGVLPYTCMGCLLGHGFWGSLVPCIFFFFLIRFLKSAGLNSSLWMPSYMANKSSVKTEPSSRVLEKQCNKGLAGVAI